MRQSLTMSEGSAWIFLRLPITLPINVASVVTCSWPRVASLRARLRPAG